MNALLLIDLQNDFLPTGTLPVPHADQLIPLANALMPRFKHIIATQDWHPKNHGSFASNHPGKKPFQLAQLAGMPQMLWPDHCIQNTPGADFPPALHSARLTHIIHKGQDPAIDSYSGFFDNGHQKETGLHAYLQSQAITHLTLAGLATDYCVKATALDARQLGYAVHLIQNACRGVNLNPGDIDRALTEMRQAGVVISANQTLQGVP